MRYEMSADEGEPGGVQAVQGPKTAFGIPPSLSSRGEASDLLWIDRGGYLAHDFGPFR
jgi:hypothetical protein